MPPYNIWHRVHWLDVPDIRKKGSACILSKNNHAYNLKKWVGLAQSVELLDTGWMFRGSKPGEGKFFRTRPDRTWSLPSLL
jgi:hypothetical protein